MAPEIKTDALKRKLLQIEKNIEEENGRVRQNRMPARYFMFFFLIGGDDESRMILERKVKALLRNPDACEVMRIDENADGTECGRQAEAVLKRAADEHADVQDLNTVFLCPILFSRHNLGSDAVPFLKGIDAYLSCSGHELLWQPSVIMEKNISEYRNIYSTVSEISRFIADMPQGRVNRCCLLSNLDENGFAVPKESIMQTVAMTVVLQNVITQNIGSSQAIRTKVSRTDSAEDSRKLFFTARNASVIHPIRSLLLQRMCGALDWFSKKTDDAAVLSKIDYSFAPQIMREYLAALPHYGGAITLFPLYSLMNDASLHANLEHRIKEKYTDPLCGSEVRKVQLVKAKAAFLNRFFVQNGSLFKLKALIRENALEHDFLQHKMQCYETIPLHVPTVDRKKLAEFSKGEYAAARAYCEDRIRNSGWELLEDLQKQLSDPEMLRSIEKAQEHIESVKDCIVTRIRQLQDAETVLVVDQTERRTDFDDVQKGFVRELALEHADDFEMFGRRFDAVIYALLQSNGETDCSELMQICYEAVRNSAYSNTEYLLRIHEECMANEERAYEFAAVVEKSWCYTLRFLHSDTTKDTTCIIGDAKNCFCRKLCDKFSGTLFDFSGFDRIDVLHISGAFAPENILEWNKIEAMGKEEQNESC